MKSYIGWRANWVTKCILSSYSPPWLKQNKTVSFCIPLYQPLEFRVGSGRCLKASAAFVGSTLDEGGWRGADTRVGVPGCGVLCLGRGKAPACEWATSEMSSRLLGGQWSAVPRAAGSWLSAFCLDLRGEQLLELSRDGALVTGIQACANLLTRHKLGEDRWRPAALRGPCGLIKDQVPVTAQGSSTGKATCPFKS